VFRIIAIGKRQKTDYCFLKVASRYWNEPYFKALNQIRPVVEKHKLTMAEVALRWISHHSLLKREYRDAVLIGMQKYRGQICGH
jgi:aryl-alcohol dehydrogenase-like predicted oxidoreductase